jgi:tetratricopeptide (TPR) repeat protein
MRFGVVALAFIAGAAFAAPVRAGGEDAGTTSPFGLGAGCRSVAMGGASAAVWGDSYALFRNPAGLFSVERDEVDLFHTSLFDESTAYSALALSHSFLNLGVLSFGAIQLRVGGIERRDDANMLIGEDFTNVQTRYALGYAQQIVKGFTAGLNLKLDRFTQGSYSANGFGLDAGLGLETPVHSPAVDGIAVGVSFRNLLEPSINLVERTAGDPRGVRAGLSVWKSISSRLRDRLTIAVDADKARFSDGRIQFGAEYGMKDLFAVRGGWDGSDPTFGCGFTVRQFILDYAYRSTELGGNHLFALAFRFGASRTQKSERAQKRHDEEIRREIEAQIASYEGRAVQTGLAEGRDRLANGDYAGATDRFGRVLLWSPSDKEAADGLRRASAALAISRGDSLMAQGKYAAALLSYRESQKRLPSNDASERIRRCEQRAMEYSNAERTKEEMLAKAIELYAERNWSDAGLCFKEVLAIDSKNAIAADYLARARGKIQEQREKVIGDADRFVAEGRFSAAIQSLTIEYEKNVTDVRLEAKIAAITRLQKEAERTKQQAVEPAGRGTALSADELTRLGQGYERGIGSFSRGDFSRAIDEWEAVYRTAPRFKQVSEYLVKAYQYLGMERYANHEYGKALEVWNRIFSVDPDNEKALRYINKTKEELSRLEGITNR